MKELNIKISDENIIKNGISADIILIIAENVNENTLIYFKAKNAFIRLLLEKAIKNLLSFYQINNIQFSPEELINGKEIIDNNILGLYFSDNTKEIKLKNNPNLSFFIAFYENYFGKLPFFIEKNKDIDKFIFLNDTIFKFGDELSVVH